MKNSSLYVNFSLNVDKGFVRQLVHKSNAMLYFSTLPVLSVQKKKIILITRRINTVHKKSIIINAGQYNNISFNSC